MIKISKKNKHGKQKSKKDRESVDYTPDDGGFLHLKEHRRKYLTKEFRKLEKNYRDSAKRKDIDKECYFEQIENLILTLGMQNYIVPLPLYNRIIYYDNYKIINQDRLRFFGQTPKYHGSDDSRDKATLRDQMKELQEQKEEEDRVIEQRIEGNPIKNW